MTEEYGARRPIDRPAPLSILHLEDSPLDAELVRRTLRQDGSAIEVEVASDRATYEALLTRSAFDVILADYSLPGYDAHDALALAKAVCPETPFVCVSGMIGEEATAELLKRGADDCVLKDHLARLPFAIRRAIDDKARERALRESEALHQSIMSASPDNITVTDLQGRVRTASPVAWDMFGYARDYELLGRPLTEFLVSEDRDCAMANVARMLQGELLAPGEYRGLRADGSSFPLEVNGDIIRDADGRPASLVFVVRDISERERTQEALRQNRALLEAIIGGTTDAVYVKDAQGRYLLFNAAAERITGKRSVDVLGEDDRVLFPADEAAVVMAGDQEVLEGGTPTTYEETVTDATGGRSTFLSTKGPLFDEGGTAVGLYGIARDITARKQAENVLRESELKYRTVADNTYDWEWWTATDGRYLYVSPSCERITGHTAAEFLADAGLLLAITHPDDRARLTAHVEACGRQTADENGLEFRIVRPDGEERLIGHGCTEIVDEGGASLGRRGSHRDLTEMRRASTELRERERELRTLMGNLPGMAYRCADDRARSMSFVSAGCEALTGYAPKALLDNAHVAYGDLVWAEDAARLWDDTRAAVARREPWTATYRITTAAGERRWVWERGVAVTNGDGELVLEGFIQDVTAQREAEMLQRRASAEWRRTFDAMRDSVAVIDSDSRIVRCNAATTALTGRNFTDLVGRRCYEVFHGTDDYIADCPHQRALTSRRPETSLLLQNGAWLRTTFEPEIDEAGHVQGGVHVITDVTELKQAEQQLLANVTTLENITEGVIAALSLAVEVRDPYTGGHERRVSALATAMAQHMGFAEDSVRCVRIAAMLHDVGKIVVPAEILTRPGRLSAAEFDLVKAHPRAGHEIVASVEFSCPIAEVILQHHERLDGSGYPAGLTGEEILPEARVLAVADVMEAMISHRPYRAALPLGAAIAELEDGAGTIYDAAACRSAVMLVRDQGFTLSD